MPTVKKTHGNVVTIRDVGRFERGDRAEVDEEMAAYLCDERGDFELVDEDDDQDDAEDDDAEDGDAPLPGDEPADADLVDQGICPWCDEYEGDHVGRHAASAHPDSWDEYNEG